MGREKKQEEDLQKAKFNSDIANRAKSEFLTNMSHELRTPLNSIIGFSEIIKNEIYGPISQKEYVDYIHDIHDSGERLLEVINEILDVSKIEAGERVLNEGRVDVEKIVQACLSIFAAKIKDNAMDVTNMLQGIPKIYAEELAVKQVVMNVVSNAVKFTPHGGRLTISYELENDGALRISFTDTGIGLNEEEVEKALSPFGQVDSELDRAGSGTGLGLTLVQSLMGLHKGSLEMFSQKGIGTTVTLVFPVDRVLMTKEENV